MRIAHADRHTEDGPGVSIQLTGNDVAHAIAAWLVAHGVNIQGPRTISVNGGMCRDAHVYVAPSGSVDTGGEYFSGRGPDTSQS